MPKIHLCGACGNVIEKPKTTKGLCAYCHMHINGRTYVEFLAADQTAADTFFRNRDMDKNGIKRY
jgi:ribosomal protein L37AE/L43A